MSEQPPGTDISAADLDVGASDERPATSDPDSFEGDETLGGLGGAEGTEGGDG